MRGLWICLLLVAPLSADTLVLENGLELQGRVSEEGDRVSVTLDGRTRTFDRARVARIERGTTAREQATGSAPRRRSAPRASCSPAGGGCCRRRRTA